jgi:large subunit ribosomal protein L34e
MTSGVKRVVYRRHVSYNTKSNKIRKKRTPGHRLLACHVKKQGKYPACGDCGGKILGLPMSRPYDLSRLKKKDRSVTRAYGGSRCHKCVKNRIKRAFLIEEQMCVKQVLSEKQSAGKETTKKSSKK